MELFFFLFFFFFLFSPFANSLTISLLSLGILILILFRQRKKLSSHVNLPPGKLGWPVIGETFSFATSSKQGYLEQFTFDRMARYSPKVFKTSILGEKMAVICDPPGNKFVFSNENKLVRSWFPSSLVNIIIPDLKITAHEEFLRRRKLFSEFLKPDAVQRYVETMDRMTREHMDLEWSPNSNVKVFPLAKRLVFMISSCLFVGTDYSDQVFGLEHQFEMVGDGFLSVPVNLPGTPYRRAVNAGKFMVAEFVKIIRAEKLQDSSKNDGRNLMSHLISATDNEGEMLSESDIAKMLMGILIASHETTSSLLTNIVYFLADHPHVYALALKEQVEIKSSKGELLTWEDTKRMKYCRNVINEVLRLATPLGGVFRDVIHDISYEGCTIPKGWKIFCSVNSIHKDPKYFPNPKEFDPTRFEGSGPVPYSFTPFGGGPRMCLGAEFARQVALVFMHNLLINFKWEKLIPNEKIILAPSSFPAKGLPIKLQRRGGDSATI